MSSKIVFSRDAATSTVHCSSRLYWPSLVLNSSSLAAVRLEFRTQPQRTLPDGIYGNRQRLFVSGRLLYSNAGGDNRARSSSNSNKIIEWMSDDNDGLSSLIFSCCRLFLLPRPWLQSKSQREIGRRHRRRRHRKPLRRRGYGADSDS